MKRLSAIALFAALAVGCTACAAPARSSALRPAAPRVLSEVELSAALLKVSDLPPGYVPDPESGDPSAGAGGGGAAEPDSSGNPACDAIFAAVRGTGTMLNVAGATEAEVEFTRGELGPIVSQSLYSAGNRAAVRAAFDSFRRIPAQCGEFNESDDDGSFAVRLTDAKFGVVGDDSFAIRLEATGTSAGTGTGVPAEVRLGGYLVLIRSAATTSMIVHVGIPGVDQAETQKIAQAAAARLTPLTRPR